MGNLWMEVLARGTQSATMRKMVGATENIVRKQEQFINPAEFLSNLGKSTTQNAEKVTLTSIRTPDFNLIIGKIKSIDPIVAESIENRLKAYNLDSVRGLQKAKDLISTTVNDYSIDIKAFNDKVVKTRNIIDENARKAAEAQKMYKLRAFLEETKSYNYDLGEKLIAKIVKMEETDPKRAESFVTGLINRYGDGYNIAQVYRNLQEKYTPRFGEMFDFNSFHTL